MLRPERTIAHRFRHRRSRAALLIYCILSVHVGVLLAQNSQPRSAKLRHPTSSQRSRILDSPAKPHPPKSSQRNPFLSHLGTSKLNPALYSQAHLASTQLSTAKSCPAQQSATHLTSHQQTQMLTSPTEISSPHTGVVQPSSAQPSSTQIISAKSKSTQCSPILHSTAKPCPPKSPQRSPILGLWWASPGTLLSHLWASHGSLLDLYWASSYAFPLGLSWAYPEPIPGHS